MGKLTGFTKGWNPYSAGNGAVIDNKPYVIPKNNKKTGNNVIGNIGPDGKITFEQSLTAGDLSGITTSVPQAAAAGSNNPKTTSTWNPYASNTASAASSAGSTSPAAGSKTSVAPSGGNMPASSSGGVTYNSANPYSGSTPSQGSSSAGYAGTTGSVMNPQQANQLKTNQGAPQVPVTPTVDNRTEDQKLTDAYKKQIKDSGGTKADLAAADSALADKQRQDAALYEQQANYQKAMDTYNKDAKAYIENINKIEGQQTQALLDSKAAWEKVNERAEAAVVAANDRTQQHLGKIEELFSSQKDTLEGAKAQALQANVQGMMSGISETEKSIARQYGKNSAEYAAFSQAKGTTLATANSLVSAEYAKVADAQYTNFISNYTNLSSQMSMYTNYHEQMATQLLADAAKDQYANTLQFQQFQIAAEQLKMGPAENIANLMMNMPVVATQSASLVANLANLVPPTPVNVPEIAKTDTSTAAVAAEAKATTPDTAAQLAEAKKSLPVMDSATMKKFESVTADQLTGLTPEKFAQLYFGYTGPMDTQLKEHYSAIMYQVRMQAEKLAAAANNPYQQVVSVSKSGKGSTPFNNIAGMPGLTAQNSSQYQTTTGSKSGSQTTKNTSAFGYPNPDGGGNSISSPSPIWS